MSDVCFLQEKQAEMEGWKQQLVEVEKERDEDRETIRKLRQVRSSPSSLTAASFSTSTENRSY